MSGVVCCTGGVQAHAVHEPACRVSDQPGGENYYALIIAKCMVRLYFAYLIFSYFMRIDRGESLLVEYGERKLSKMIE